VTLLPDSATHSFSVSATKLVTFWEEGGVDECGDLYEYGEWGGIVFTTVLGGVQGVRAAGVKIPQVTEFSHAIAARHFRALSRSVADGPSWAKTSVRWIRRKFERSLLNGNHETAGRHYKYDYYRRLAREIELDLGPKWHPAIRALDRLPKAVAGPLLGLGVGVGAASGNNCGCKS
jgi:hypothetical protein